MKQSRYNLFFKKDDRKLVYNQLSSSILELDDDLFRCLTNDNVVDIPSDIQEDLGRDFILVDENLEKKMLLCIECNILNIMTL